MRRRFFGISSGMGEKTILVGCCEPPVTEAIKVLLKGGRHIIERTRMDEFVREASTGEYDSVVLCANSIAPPLLLNGDLLENAVAAVRWIKAARSIPVIALTSTPEWHDALLRAGADSCVTTPFRPTDFRQAVDGCLQRRG